MIFPLVAPTGTVAMMDVEFHTLVVAVIPLNVTDPELPKLVPEIVTDWPIPIGFGMTDVIVGVCVYARPQPKIRIAQALTLNLSMNCGTPNPP